MFGIILSSYFCSMLGNKFEVDGTDQPKKKALFSRSLREKNSQTRTFAEKTTRDFA